MRKAVLVVVAALTACGDPPAPAKPVVAPAPPPVETPKPPAAETATPPARPWSEWIDELSSPDEAVKKKAFDALRDGGDAPVPALLAKYFEKHEWRLLDEDLVRLLAARRDVVVPELLARLRAGEKDGDSCVELLGIVGECGGYGRQEAAVVETLLSCGRDGDAEGWIVGHCGAAAEAVVPTLVERFAEPTRSQTAFVALRALGPRARGAVRPLLALLEKEYAVLPDMAVLILGSIGPDAHEALPWLEEQVRSHGPSPARWAITRIGVGDAAAVDALWSAFRNPDDGTRMTALKALDAMGDRSPAFVAALVEMTRPEHATAGNASKQEDTSAWSAYAADRLAAFVVEEPSVAVEMKRCLYGDEGACGAAGDALRKSAAARAKVVPLLVAEAEKDLRALQALVALDDPAARDVALRVLPDASGETRLWAVEALGCGGRPPDDATLAALLAAAKDPDAAVAREAAWSIERLRTAPPELVSALVARLDDRYVRASACDALAALGVKDERLVPLLFERLHAELEGRADAVVRRANALGREGRPTPRLRIRLDEDPDVGCGVAAAKSLGRLGVIEPLVEAMRADGWFLSEVGAVGFAELPHSCLDAVCGYAEDPDESVRGAVAEWLGRFQGARAEAQLLRMIAPDFPYSIVELARFPSLSPETVAVLRREARVAESTSCSLPAAMALWPAGGDAASAAVALAAHLDRGTRDQMFESAMPWATDAVERLVAMGGQARPALGRIVSFLRPPLERTRARCALLVLRSFPTEAKDAVPDVAAIVSGRVRQHSFYEDDRDAELRRLAAEFLGETGGVGAVDGLREALLDPHRVVREAAKASLAKLGAK